MARSAKFDNTRKEMLKDPELAAHYLEESLESGDLKEFTEALKHVAQAQEGGIAKVAADAELNREQLYKSLSKMGNPRLDTLTKVLHSVGLRLAVVPEIRA